MGNSETGSDEHDNPSHSIATSFSSTYAIFKFFIALPFANKKAPQMRGYTVDIPTKG